MTTSKVCRRRQALAQAIQRITQDDGSRRELLWLRAVEKGDERSRRDLEEIEPGLRRRMRHARARIEAAAESDRGPTAGRLWDEMYARLIGGQQAAVACDCLDCV